MPPGWQSQDKFVRHLEAEPIETHLKYQKISYGEHDWDNIPPVVPRFIFHLVKYMQGVTAEIDELVHLESVASLRKECEKRLGVSMISNFNYNNHHFLEP